MAASALHDRLNDLLVDLRKSLLQYSQEAWPWSGQSGAEDVRQTLNRLAAEQEQSVADLVELLDSRGHAIDFGTYPDEYTSLHYVSVEYLLDQLTIHTTSLIEAYQSVPSEVAEDQEVSALVEQILSREQTAASEIRDLKP